jgi:hypothetical protein
MEEKSESCRRMGRKTRRDYAWDLKEGSVSCYLWELAANARFDSSPERVLEPITHVPSDITQ